MFYAELLERKQREQWTSSRENETLRTFSSSSLFSSAYWVRRLKSSFKIFFIYFNKIFLAISYANRCMFRKKKTKQNIKYVYIQLSMVKYLTIQLYRS